MYTLSGARARHGRAWTCATELAYTTRAGVVLVVLFQLTSGGAAAPAGAATAVTESLPI
jgi:hypothetical protein